MTDPTPDFTSQHRQWALKLAVNLACVRHIDIQDIEAWADRLTAYLGQDQVPTPPPVAGE